jgi:acetyl-CoA synthetase
MLWIESGGECRQITFAQLDAYSNQVANILKGLGYACGDVFCIMLPKCPEVFYWFLGILKYRMIAMPLFSNTGDTALYERLADSGCRGIVIRKSALNKVKRIWGNLPRLQYIVVIDLPEHESAQVLSLRQLMNEAERAFECEITPARTPALIHYTSGSTGRPKGVLHHHICLRRQQKSAMEVLDLQSTDMYWCTADHAWITGTAYGIIAPWSMGITQLHYGGAFDSDMWLQLLEQYRISVWYTAPTALRMLMQNRALDQNHCGFRHLRHIFSVGEPLNPEIMRWAEMKLGTRIYDTWFQTETGGIMIANRPGQRVKPGSMGMPVGGIEARIINEEGAEARTGEHGLLALKSGWDSMFCTYLNQEQAYAEKFAHGFYLSGDVALQDEDGYFWFKGRSDDIINTGGHLVSPFEIESALLEREEVAESAVVGVADEVLYEKVVAFIRLNQKKKADRNTEINLRLHISNRVSSIATPQEMVFVESIPKNSSGKIMRRILKAGYEQRESGDTSTVDWQSG